MIKKGSQNHRVLLSLADYQWHTASAIHREVGPCRLNSRVAELRDRHGFDIECVHIPGRSGAQAYRYRLLSAVPADLMVDDLSRKLAARMKRDEVPKTPGTRYRLYRLAGPYLELLETRESIFDLAIALMRAAIGGAFAGSTIGVLDTKGTDAEPGEWIINPWDTTP